MKRVLPQQVLSLVTSPSLNGCLCSLYMKTQSDTVEGGEEGQLLALPVSEGDGCHIAQSLSLTLVLCLSIFFLSKSTDISTSDLSLMRGCHNFHSDVVRKLFEPLLISHNSMKLRRFPVIHPYSRQCTLYGHSRIHPPPHRHSLLAFVRV